MAESNILTTANTSRETLHEVCSEKYELLRKAVLDTLPESHHPLHDEANFHFKRSGKHLRGLTTLLLADALNADLNSALQWAISVELMHNASLIHDDICDQDTSRRGQTSIWREFGTNKSLCLGDWLVARSFQLAVSAMSNSSIQSFNAVSDLAESMMTLCSGQAREFDRKPILDWFGYDRVVIEKTSPLISAAILGPIYFSGNTGFLAPLNKIVDKIGLAYQIANDIDNARARQSGKLTFTDLWRGSPNAVVVNFAETSSDRYKRDFHHWCEAQEYEDTDIWITRIHASDALAKTQRRLVKLLTEIDARLLKLPTNVTSSLEPILNHLHSVASSEVLHD